MVERARVRREFADFYRREVRFAWRVLRRLGVDPYDCEDALQDAFTTAHHRWDTIVDPRRRRAWLAGIIRRVAWRYRRTRDRRARRLEAVAERTLETPGLDDEFARREAWAALLAFLDGLDAGRREAFVLGELESLGRVELGHALGINPNTAYSRLQSARRSFVAHFAERTDVALTTMIASSAISSGTEERSWARVWSGLLMSLELPAVGILPKVAVAWAIAGLATLGTTVAMARLGEPSRSLQPPPAFAARVSMGGAVAPATAPTEVRETDLGADVRAEVRETAPEVEAPAYARAGALGTDARAELDSGSTPESAPTSVTPTSQPDAATTGVRTVDAEVRLLVAARGALARGASEEARRILGEHRRRFGDTGDLGDVRRGLEIELMGSITPVAGGD